MRLAALLVLLSGVAAILPEPMPVRAPDLDREQLRIVRAAEREARHVAPRNRRRFLRSAIQTGLVESGLRNLDFGHADSLGWRQERASLYRNPTNVRASMRRFRQEWQQHADPGEKSWEISAQVQRPREDLRGRYREEAGVANAILRAYIGQGGGGPRVRAAGGDMPGLAPEAVAFDPGSTQAIQSALEGLGPPQANVPTAGLAPPVDARAAMALPAGYSLQQPSSPPAPAVSLADRIAQISGGGQDVSFGTPQTYEDHRKAARRRQGKGGLEGANPERIVSSLEAWAADELGLGGGSRDRSRESNAAAGGAADSDHLEGGGEFKGREAIDLPTTAAGGGWGQYRRVARKLGLTPDRDGFTQGTVKIGGKKFRVQVIFGEAHDHGDHIHIGIRRA